MVIVGYTLLYIR